MNHLYRSPDDRVIAGVAGGMAEAWDLDPALVRVGWAFLILITGGLFLLLYLVMVIVVPLRPLQQPLWAAAGAGAPMPSAGLDGQPTYSPPPGPGAPDLGTAPQFTPTYSRHYRRERRDGAGALVFGLILIVVGVFFLLRQYIPALDFGLIWPLIVIAGGALLIIAALNRTQQQS